MILDKIYEVNLIDADSVILEIAEDIKNGYTLRQIEMLSLAVCKDTYDLRPAYRITLHNKRIERETMKGVF